MYGKPRWPNAVCCAESTDSYGTRRGNSASSESRLLVQTPSRLYVNFEFRLLLTEDYYITIQLHGALSHVAYRHELACPRARTAVILWRRNELKVHPLSQTHPVHEPSNLRQMYLIGTQCHVGAESMGGHIHYRNKGKSRSSVFR